MRMLSLGAGGGGGGGGGGVAVFSHRTSEAESPSLSTLITTTAGPSLSHHPSTPAPSCRPSTSKATTTTSPPQTSPSSLHAQQIHALNQLLQAQQQVAARAARIQNAPARAVSLVGTKALSTGAITHSCEKKKVFTMLDSNPFARLHTYFFLFFFHSHSCEKKNNKNCFFAMLDVNSFARLHTFVCMELEMANPKPNFHTSDPNPY